MMGSTRTVQLQYFAVFREQRGIGAETCQTAAMTPRQLYAELQQAHDFKLSTDHVRVAVNDEFADWDSTLPENAKVVFIPPVAGG